MASWDDVFALWALLATAAVVWRERAARATQRRMIRERVAAYTAACKSLPLMVGALSKVGYETAGEEGRAQVQRAAVQLVVLVDLLYGLASPQAADWAVCLDDYAGLLASGFPLEDFSSHPETKAAIQEARAHPPGPQPRSGFQAGKRAAKPRRRSGQTAGVWTASAETRDR